MTDNALSSKAPVIPIKGITSIDKVSIVNLEGASLIGVPGVAMRFMAAMSSANINVLMITQVHRARARQPQRACDDAAVMRS